jgi:hypothetical protein
VVDDKLSITRVGRTKRRSLPAYGPGGFADDELMGDDDFGIGIDAAVDTAVEIEGGLFTNFGYGLALTGRVF